MTEAGPTECLSCGTDTSGDDGGPAYRSACARAIGLEEAEEDAPPWVGLDDYDLGDEADVDTEAAASEALMARWGIEEEP
jgi:hypothetical protein